MHELKGKTRDAIWIVCCSVAFIILQILIIYMNRIGRVSFNGVLSAFQYGVCLLMLNTNRKKGLNVSIALMSLSIIMLLRALIVSREERMLPGLFNGIFYLITLIILAHFHWRREKESITDVLTGVMNRRGLYKNLKERIESRKEFHVLYICLDNFKYINDTYGHAYGDELLRRISDRMVQKLGDTGALARIGGTDFVVVIDGSLPVESTADELLEIVREKYSLEIGGVRGDCYITCYAGASCYPADAGDYESLVKYADIAMLDAKGKKSKTVRIFNRDMAGLMNHWIETEKLVNEGIQKNYFFLEYQPQFQIDGKKLRGFEALVRMNDAEGRRISPGEFIPIAEKSDLVLQIDEYVLKHAMTEFKPMIDLNSHLILSVNVSAKNMGDKGFPDKVKSIIDETGFKAENLEIEITEYCMVHSMDVTTDNIHRLRGLGIQVALDDFGTGYTSLNYVAKLPINLLKIDKSLVDDVLKSNQSREFIHMVISLGHLMGCEVVSEGVEDDNQLSCLKEDGCDLVQGYVWGRPVALEDAKQLIL